MKAATTYCVSCDALVGECSHDGPRYLDPIVYEKTEYGWNAPADDREHFDHPERFRSVRPSVGGDRPIQTLVVELEAWLFLGGPLETRLRSAYEADPVKVTRLVETVIAGAKSNRLRNPPGLLAKELRDLGH